MYKNTPNGFSSAILSGSRLVILGLMLFVLMVGGWSILGCKSSSNQSATATQTEPADTTAPKPKTKTLPQTAYRLPLDANKVQLPNNRGTFTYRIQYAVVEPLNATEKKITFTLRAIFDGIGQGALWEENFKLALNSGEVLAANNPQKQMVNPSTTVNKDISFTIPKSERYVRFVIMGLGGKSASIPLDLAIEQN
ncbi:MAG TPA: hypothetical protein PK239_16285 [Chitinophagales bacterium]|nr:hypothetical protein [Chitinophagales bacterium]HRK28834.1 hypothetical protein [Chitinophagales bacterium]